MGDFSLQLFDHEPTEEEVAELAAEAEARFAAYEGDEYLMQVFSDLPYDEAKAKVQEPAYLCFNINWGGLPHVLADKVACAGLKRELLLGNQQVLAALGKYAQRFTKRPAKKKPGPKPKAAGKYKKDWISALREQGLSLSQISMTVYGTTTKGNLVAAHLKNQKAKPNPNVDDRYFQT